MSQQTTYNTLDEAMEALTATLTQLQCTLQEVRTTISNEPRGRSDYDFTALMQNNVEYANELLNIAGFAAVSDLKLAQWGILDASCEVDVRRIIDSVIEYRTSK